jgi:chromosome segregation ATPase
MTWFSRTLVIQIETMGHTYFSKEVGIMKRIFLNIVLITTASVFFIAPQAVSGQTERTAESPRNEEREILKALLEEVRQLRLELQRTNAFSQRLLVTLERIRLQQTRVDSLTRSLQTVRSQLAEMRDTRTRIEGEIKESEERMSLGSDPDTRSILESQIKEMKNRLTALTREEEQARRREADLNTELDASRARLNDLNNQLDTMMRQLETP